MDFEWDEDKRKANLAKHGVDFLDAQEIWLGGVIDPAGERHVAEEVRKLAIGAIGDALLIIAVVYTGRNGSRRIISARRARRSERALFVSEFGYGG